jgi:hypothetical protein
VGLLVRPPDEIVVPAAQRRVRLLPNIRPLGLRWRYAPPKRKGLPADVWTDRLIILGATGTGKSTLAEAYIADALRRYPTLRVLVLDSKPRFRGEFETSGLNAAWRYRRQAHGTAPFQDSIALSVTDPARDLPNAWRFDARLAIAQAPRGADDVDMLYRLLETASVFFDQGRADRPQLLYVDEVMDFFYMNGSPIGKDMTIIQTVRAGRELGIGGMFATQRPRGIPAQLLQESNALDLFWLRNVEDLERLTDFSLPNGEALMPRKNNKNFYHYNHERPGDAGTYRLDLN